MGKMLVIKGAKATAAAIWAAKHGFYHAKLKGETRIYHLLAKREWYAKYLREVGVV